MKTEMTNVNKAFLKMAEEAIANGRASVQPDPNLTNKFFFTLDGEDSMASYESATAAKVAIGDLLNMRAELRAGL